MEYSPRRPWMLGLLVLAVIYVIYTTRLKSGELVSDTTEAFHETIFPDNSPFPKPYGHIRDKVAVISDTQYTPRLIPLILHFHAVLGPDWPVILYTTQETHDKHLVDNSAIWQLAIDDGRVDVRIIPKEFDLTQRQGVNLYLSRPWLWEQLAPAHHVLIFQADTMLCANSRRTIESFFEYDFIGAPLNPTEKLFNGGLSLRNRAMVLAMLSSKHNNWEEETAAGTWTMGGEDIWFSQRMEEWGGNLPEIETALEFACEHEYHVDRQKKPLGYHKVHKYAGSKISKIAEWCPEIALAAPGTLGQSEGG